MLKNVFISCLTLIGCNLFGEIQTATVLWDAPFCRNTCPTELERAFLGVKNAKAVRMYPSGGRADFEWQEGKPVSYQMFKRPMQNVGVSLLQIYVKVRGTIVEQGERLFLKSSGDSMSFEMIGAPVADTPTQFLKSSTHPRALEPNLRATLVGLMKEKKVVIVEGLFYQAYRAPPNRLVTTRVSVEKEKKEEKK